MKLNASRAAAAAPARRPPPCRWPAVSAVCFRLAYLYAHYMVHALLYVLSRPIGARPDGRNGGAGYGRAAAPKTIKPMPIKDGQFTSSCRCCNRRRRRSTPTSWVRPLAAPVSSCSRHQTTSYNAQVQLPQRPL